jgi:serine/threonine protein kinase
MLNPGSLLADRYLISRILGSGNFSTVYLAQDRRLGGKFVAVKEFNPASFPEKDREWARQTIRHEAHLRAQLASHPNLADVTDYFEADGREYLVIEYVEGETLRRVWEQQPGRRFDTPRVLSWAAQLLGALDFLHGHQPPVIYRDLKPQNIMVRPDGSLKLIDFGIHRPLPQRRQVGRHRHPGHSGLCGAGAVRPE